MRDAMQSVTYGRIQEILKGRGEGVVHLNNFRRHRLYGKQRRSEILEAGRRGQGHAFPEDSSDFTL